MIYFSLSSPFTSPSCLSPVFAFLSLSLIPCFVFLPSANPPFLSLSFSFPRHSSLFSLSLSLPSVTLPPSLSPPPPLFSLLPPNIHIIFLSCHFSFSFIECCKSLNNYNTMFHILRLVYSNTLVM